MLGSVSEAEDVAQEALLRLTRQESRSTSRPPGSRRWPRGSRSTSSARRGSAARPTSGRGCRSRCSRTRRPSPAARAELADSLSLALLALLERLTPVERAAYLLREVFGYEYAPDRRDHRAHRGELATARDPGAQAPARPSRPRFDADEAARDALLERFLAAAEEGDLEALEELLAQDAVLYADSGGKAMAPQEPLVGAALIARFMAAVAQVRAPSGELESRPVRVNGQPGRLVRGPAEPPLGDAERQAAEQALALLTVRRGRREQIAALVKGAETPPAAGRPRPSPAAGRVHVWSVLTVDVFDGRIQTVRIVRNPDKLAHL